MGQQSANQNDESRTLTEAELARCLQSIGKACFVKYYHLFSDPNINDEDIAGILMKSEGYTRHGCEIRIDFSDAIIKSGSSRDAFQNILQSKRVPQSIRDQARILLAQIS